jgi:hypothetical protein
MKYRVQNGMKQSKRRAIAYNQAISSIHVMFSTLFPACFERLFFIRKSCHPFFPSNIKKRTFSLRRQLGLLFLSLCPCRTLSCPETELFPRKTGQGRSNEIFVSRGTRYHRIDHTLLHYVTNVLPNGLQLENTQYVVFIRKDNQLGFAIPTFTELMFELQRNIKRRNNILIN